MPNTHSVAVNWRHDGLEAGSARRFHVLAINADGFGPVPGTATERRGNPNLKVLPQAAAEGKAVVFTVSRPIAAASHLSQGVLWDERRTAACSARYPGAGKWIASHFCHARQVRFKKGDMRAFGSPGNPLQTAVIGARAVTVRAILDDGLSSNCETQPRLGTGRARHRLAGPGDGGGDRQ